MFHWICPECGREIPPAVKECPACDPGMKAPPVEPAAPPLAALAAEPEPAPDPLLALAEHIRRAQQEPEPEPEPEPAAVGVAAASAAPPAISITQFFPKIEAIALLAPPAEGKTLPPAPLAAAATVPVEPTSARTAPEPAKPQPVAHAVPVITDLPQEKLPSGSWLRLAPLQDYTAAAAERMRPAPPRNSVLVQDAGPRITLPGPALPPALQSFQDAGVVTVIGPPKASRRRLPGWLASAMIVLGIPLAGGALLLYLQPVEHSEAKAPTPAPVAAVASAPVPVMHSVADLIEVTGFRIIVDFNKKSEIHYLVVNHSSAPLSDMTVYVTLRTADARPGQPPLSRFSFRAPALGPFESKEMTSPIEKLARPTVVPDWQDLRADVQVGQ
jgi:hypothetical protein